MMDHMQGSHEVNAMKVIDLTGRKQVADYVFNVYSHKQTQTWQWTSSMRGFVFQVVDSYVSELEGVLHTVFLGICFSLLFLVLRQGCLCTEVYVA